MIIIYFLQFILFIFLIVFPLGKFLLNYLKIKLSFWESLLVGINIGIVVLILLVYIFGIIGLEKLFYFFPILSFIFLLEKRKLFEKYNRKLFLKIDFKLLGLLTLIVILCGYLTFFSGQVIDGQLRLIGGNTHDGLWHLALINNIKKNIPPENPIYAHAPIQNYHYLTDIFVAVSSNFTKLPVIFLYFNIIEPFFVILFSATIFIFIKKLTNNKILSYFGVILVVLSSNLFYLVQIFYPSAYFSPSVLWVDEFITRAVNPQLLLSYIIILTLLYLILIYEKITSLKFIVSISIIGASLLGIKSYGFIVFSMSLLIVSLFLLVKKELNYFKISIGLLFAGAAFYLLSNITKEAIFILSPFWFIKSMFETPDHLAYPTWELRRQTFLEHKNYLRVAQLYIEGLALFLLGNLGGRLIGLFALSVKLENRKKEVVRILWVMALISLILPMIFIQKGVAWNSIQFFYYSILSFGLLNIVVLKTLYTNHKYLVYILAGMIWVTLLPGIFYNINKYYPGKTQIHGSSDSLAAVQFLKNQQDGVVLIYPQYMQDSFIPALSEKTAFFADETILSIQLVNFDTRKKEIESFFSEGIFNTREDFLKRNDIKYILTKNNEKIISKNKFNYTDGLKIQKIYSNKEVIIYKTL